MDCEKYKVTIPYPAKPTRPSLSVHPTPGQLREHAYALERYENAVDAWREKVRDFHNAVSKAQESFRADVLEYCGLTGHPKADAVFALAESEGHSEGFEAVAEWVSRLADLVKG